MVRPVAGDLPEQVKNNQSVNMAAGNGGQKMSQYPWFTVYGPSLRVSPKLSVLSKFILCQNGLRPASRTEASLETSRAVSGPSIYEISPFAIMSMAFGRRTHSASSITRR